MRLPTFKKNQEPKPFDLGFIKTLHSRAERMRLAPTKAEFAFNMLLLKLGIDSDDIKCQHVISPYIYDFYIKSLNLLVEIDGSSHQDTKRRDFLKTALAFKKGHRFLRLQNIEVPGVTMRILSGL